MRFRERVTTATAQWFHQQWQQGRVGAIAPIATPNAATVQAYLAQECQRLQAAGYGGAIAPLKRNTWYSYRCIVESNARPLFWQEPDLPDYWCGALAQQGFTPIAYYHSAECTDLGIVDPRYSELRDRFTQNGIRLRAVNLQTPTIELEKIYRVAIAAFAKNFCFTPIPFGEFHQLYEPLLPRLNPEMVLLAAAGETIIGFALGIPDLRASSKQTVILKTVAVLTQRRYGGLGRWLVAAFHNRAAKQGYQRIIHALMHDANFSCNLSRRYATQTFRRYALWGKVFGH
ncbi:MAG: GNAT family N-acetyltransferase [Cyanobacteria bacterium P01_G01_bin.54]